MIEIKINKIKPEVEEYYYTRLKEFLERRLSRNLRGKAEVGSTRSEFGYQLIASSTCRNIARVFGLNEDKAEMLSMSVGLFFPKYGEEGLKVVKQYILDRKLDLNINTLGADFITFYIQEYFYGLSIDSYQLIQDYYNNIDSCEEIKIVRLVQETIKDIKKAEHFYDGYPGDLLYNVTQELVDLAKNHKTLMKSTILNQYQDKIKDFKYPSLTKEEKQKVFDRIDDFMRDFTTNTGDMAKYNKTKEEAILIYIHLEN